MILDTQKKAIIDRFYNKNPNYKEPSKFSIGIDQEQINPFDTELTNQIEFEVGVDEKAFESGYPAVDLTKLQTKIRMFINSLEANGQDIDSIAIKDENGNVYSINKFEPQNKTSATEISIIKTEIFR